MPRFPGYGFPSPYYRPYSKNSYSTNHAPHLSPPPPVMPPKEIPPPHQHTKTTKSPEPVWLDLFGIKLYFDDVLILSLLFFLYKEHVKDEGLFFALVLLLIS